VNSSYVRQGQIACRLMQAQPESSEGQGQPLKAANIVATCREPRSEQQREVSFTQWKVEKKPWKTNSKASPSKRVGLSSMNDACLDRQNKATQK